MTGEFDVKRHSLVKHPQQISLILRKISKTLQGRPCEKRRRHKIVCKTHHTNPPNREYQDIDVEHNLVVVLVDMVGMGAVQEVEANSKLPLGRFGISSGVR